MTPLFWLKLARRLVVGVLLLGLVGSAYLCGRVWWVGRGDDRRASDVILVLGASQYDGRPSAVFAARLDHAKELYDAKVAPRIVTVGGSQPGDRFTEGEAGASYLRKAGVPISALVAVGEGSDTLLSLQAAAVRMSQGGWHSAVVVTDPWHSLRSRTMARDLGLDAVASPVDEGPTTHGITTKTRYIGREAAAYLYYRLFHRASRPGPSAV